MIDTIQKFDLKTFLGPLDQKEEPKTLEECLLEAGGFPFVARAVTSTEKKYFKVLPVGTECKFHSRSTLSIGFFKNYEFDDLEVDSHIPRWVLVGHKT